MSNQKEFVFWKNIPLSVRVITLATSIRWIGWGMAEPLIPIFLYSALGSYGLSGLIDSIGKIVFLLILPFAGIFADRIPLKKFLIIGLIIFFFDGLYIVAALTGLVAFVFIANLFDGVAVASDVVGRATYIRRYSSKNQIAAVMGYQNIFINAGWVLGAIITLALVDRLPLAWIFFGIIPTNLIALLLFIRYLKMDKVQTQEVSYKQSPFSEYWKVWTDFLHWKSGIHTLAILTFFLSALSAFGSLLIPIYAYINGAGLQAVVLLTVVGMVPEVFGSMFGRFADRWNGRLFPLGLLTLSSLMVALALSETYLFLLLTLLSIKAILVLLILAVENVITALVEPSYFGRASAIFEGLKDVGKFAGAVGIGFILDYLGGPVTFLLLAVIVLSFGVLVGNRFYIPSTEE